MHKTLRVCPENSLFVFVFNRRSKRGNCPNEAFRDAYGKLAILRSMCKESKFYNR
jgi:hypothetical protein